MHHSNNSDKLFHEGHPRCLLPELSRQLYGLGWFTASGGDISIKQGKNIYVLPEGRPREKIEHEDLFILKTDGSLSISPSKENLRMSSSLPLFMKAYRTKNSEAVLYSQSSNAVLASMIYSGDEFRIKDIEMIENLWNVSENRNYLMSEEVVIPIIENNTSNKIELAEKIGETMKKYPKVSAVIIRRSGMFVWGRSWERCKATAECIDYLMKTSIEMEKLGLNEYTHNIQPTQNSLITSKLSEVVEKKNESQSTKETDTLTPSTPAASTVVKTSTPATTITNSTKKESAKKSPIKTGRVTKPSVVKKIGNSIKQTRNTRTQNNRMNRSMGNGPHQGVRGGPRLPMNSPRGHMNGPGGPMNGPGGPMNMNGPRPMMGGPMMGGPMMGHMGGPMMGPGGPMMGGPPGMMMGHGPIGSSPMNNSTRNKRQVRGGQKNRTRNAKAKAQSVIENY